MNYVLTLALIFAGLTAGPAVAYSISPKKAMALIKNEKALLIDVREKAELSSGLAQPARWIPTSSFQSRGKRWTDFQEEISKNKNIPIIVYCAVGGRASKVVSHLKRSGYKAYNMGGFRDWKKAALPIKKK
ncbi:rhodanese-like domain-containing protein [Bdellovibrionales bacterium]|nr:rhodanese-like domain-containing protein [Bdellovibrionales bacterium]